MSVLLKIEDYIFNFPYFNTEDIEFGENYTASSIYVVATDFYEDGIELITSNIPDNILPLYCEYRDHNIIKIYDNKYKNDKICKILLVNKDFYNRLKEKYKFDTILDIISSVDIYKESINNNISFLYFKWTFIDTDENQ